MTDKNIESQPTITRRLSLAEEIPPRQRTQSVADDLGRSVRPPMNQVEFDEKFAYRQPKQEEPFIHHLKKFFARFTYPFTSFLAFKISLMSLVPMSKWFPEYKYSENLMNDIIGGVTVGIMHVPQGIAYAVLAKVKPEQGLYTSLFPPLFYMIFGMSRHNSIGTFAVVSLMTGMAVKRLSDDSENDDLIFPNLNETGIATASPAEVAATLTLTVGVVQLLMGLAGLDFIITYFSDQLVSGFTTGASCHVFVSQIKDILGLRKLQSRSGPGYIVLRLYDLFVDRFFDINVFSVGISLGMMIVLIAGKEWINPFVKKKLKTHLPIPFELIVLIGGTALSYLIDFSGSHNMKIANKIPTGVPLPALPNIGLVYKVLPEALSIAVVSMAIHVSLAKMFAKKQGYEVDACQELYALGFSSIGSSFFPCFPAACSLGRTLVNVTAGTKTQLSSIFSSLCVLSVILFFARYLETLPMCALAAIVIVALKGMLDKFSELKMLWPLSKIDFSIWVVAFSATVFIDVTEGLAIAICFALFTTIMREQWPRWHLLANVEGTADFRDSERYENVCFHNGICIFRFDSPLLFTNVDTFKTSVQKAFRAWQQSHEYLVLRHEKKMLMSGTMMEETGENLKKDEKDDEDDFISRHFIIDCSGFTFVDYMGVSALKEIYSEMHKSGVQMYFAAAKAPVRDLFESSGFYAFVPKEHFYPTIRDAVAIARIRQHKKGAPTNTYHLEHDRLSEIMSSHPMN